MKVLLQPELPFNNDSTAHIQQVSPTCPKPNVSGSAIISECGKYRYVLSRIWNDDAFIPRVAFIMLNPSTADATTDDANANAAVPILHATTTNLRSATNAKTTSVCELANRVVRFDG